MKHRNLSFRLAALCAFVLTLIQCANEPNSSATGTTELVPTVLWKAGGVAVIPDAVDSVRIQVTYGTVTDSRTFPFSASHAVFPSLPTGETVDILFEGLDRAGVVIYRGTVNDVVLSGTTKEVPITAELLSPRSPANLQATAVSPTVIRLTWTDSSSSESGFIVSRAGVVLDTVLANRTTYNDTGLTASTTLLSHFGLSAFTPFAPLLTSTSLTC